jgi:beta-lactamase regulating signal transducer with metallopeptidase domain/uncharacterized GH25 family protein
MNSHPRLEHGVNWLLNNSLEAGLLVLLVLLVQFIFKRQLSSRWRFTLWWIVVARLVLPFNPPSAMSVFNFFHPTVRLTVPREAARPLVSPPESNAAGETPVPVVLPVAKPLADGEIIPRRSTVVEATENFTVSAPPAATVGVPPHSLTFDEVFIPSLAGVWLAGVLILSAMVGGQMLRFHRKLGTASAPADDHLQNLLDECQGEFGLSRRVELLETGAVQSPALFGLLRLRLLVPRGFGGQFAGRELRYIFLHELAHVKRGDLWLNWLVTGLQVLHWFNPLLWLGFARLRADRELACDELALVQAGENDGMAYGETIIKLLEGLSHPATIPGLVGILEDKKQMHRRMTMIASFRQPGRWSALAVILLGALAATALTNAQSEKPPAEQRLKVESGVNDAMNNPDNAPLPAKMSFDEAYTAANNIPDLQIRASNSPARPDVTGSVHAKGGAALLATVFVATAGPKTGSSTFCPSCYADCSKHSATDAHGAFKIEALDPQLTFQLLAVAKGYQPKYVSKVDPVQGKLVNIELDPIESADAAPDHSLRGRVVNSKGKPISGAVVEMQGIESKEGGGSWGMIGGIDPLAVTDANGEFLITAKNPFDMMTVRVMARTFADKLFDKLASGAAPHELGLTEGAALTGRVVLDGKPLAGVSVGVSAVDRRAGRYLGHFEVSTGERGYFAFVNLPPDGEFELYTLMSSMKALGAVPVRQIRTGKDGETTDAGDLPVAPAHRLAGRVVLADGLPLPEKTRLLISRDGAWDSLQVTLGKDGSFDTTGIPSELITLSVRTKGYHVSARNLSVDQLNPFQLIGRVERDITNLVFMLEKGPEPRPDYSQVDPEYDEIRQHPLRGGEGVQDHARDWTVAGRVVDSETGQPVENFRVTPGQTDNFNRTAWSGWRAVEGSNGMYVTYISKRTAQPQLKVEADGYLPAGVEIQPGDATNMDFVLKKGSGPAGTVLTPEGKPAAGATVVLLKDEMNQAELKSAGELTADWNRSAERRADTKGNFEFKPVWGMKSVAAASSDGFALVSLETLATNATIRLATFGKITGTLKRTSGPGSNEVLDVRFAEAGGLGQNQINLQVSTTTDSQGRFVFDRVPAGHLQIAYRKMMNGGRGWSSPALQEVDLKPGRKLEVSISAPDRKTEQDINSYQPPPPPKPIAGVQVKGVVLLPDGKPAADADVALQIAGEYLGLGKGSFAASGAKEKGLMVSTGPDGTFTMPMYEKALSVVVLNEVGYAQVSLEQLKASPQITLQKWGCVEGTLLVGHRPGTNEFVNLSGANPRWPERMIRPAGQTNSNSEITYPAPVPLVPPIYDADAFQAHTDSRGKFVITFVPPGEQFLWRREPAGEGSWTQRWLGAVAVEPGETTVTQVGGTGRTVTGKVNVTGEPTVDGKTGIGFICTPTFKIFEKAQQLKTDAERQAFYQSPEVAAAMGNPQSYRVDTAADGSFRAEDILPGRYEFVFQPHPLTDEKSREQSILVSAQEFTVAEAKNQADDSIVEWGAIEFKKRVLPMPEPVGK